MPNETSVQDFEYGGYIFHTYASRWAYGSRDHHYWCEVVGTNIRIRHYDRADACDAALAELLDRGLNLEAPPFLVSRYDRDFGV